MPAAAAGEMNSPLGGGFDRTSEASPREDREGEKEERSRAPKAWGNDPKHPKNDSREKPREAERSRAQTTKVGLMKSPFQRILRANTTGIKSKLQERLAMPRRQL